MFSLGLSTALGVRSSFRPPLHRLVQFPSAPSKIGTAQKLSQLRIRSGICRAEFTQDAPVALAIATCIFNSMIFPVNAASDGDGSSIIDATDARFAVMGIISFIPYFNWLGWIFAWLDTGRRRYAFYGIVYLAPYLRSNLSLSPEESWLPLASIIFCIIHIQLEAGISSGDLQGFDVFNKAAKFLTTFARKKAGHGKDLNKVVATGMMGGGEALPPSDCIKKNIEWHDSSMDSLEDLISSNDSGRNWER